MHTRPQPGPGHRPRGHTATVTPSLFEFDCTGDTASFDALHVLLSTPPATCTDDGDSFPTPSSSSCSATQPSDHMRTAAPPASFAAMALVQHPRPDAPDARAPRMDRHRHHVHPVPPADPAIGPVQPVHWRLFTPNSQSEWWHRPISKEPKYAGFFLLCFGPYQVSLGIDLLWPDHPLRRSLYYAALSLLIAAFVTAESSRASACRRAHAKRIAGMLSGDEGLTASFEEEEKASLTTFHAGTQHPAASLLPPGPAQFLSLASLSSAEV